MGGERFTEQKAAARALGLELRRALTAPELARRGGETLSRLTALPFFSRAKHVGLYAGQADEVPAQLLAATLASRAAFARFEKGSRVLSFHPIAYGALSPGPMGILQPKREDPTVPLAELDVIIVPGAAFTREGARVGRGGGYYDTTLAAARPGALRVGVCFECQVVPSIPMEPHDLYVDWVVTDAGASYCRALGAPKR
ncbi:MAG: 5-formyltetrahydrofolate cyclo-ligase [Myxococcaceae bacterium]